MGDFVGVNPEINKVAMPVVSTVEVEDAAKPQVVPVVQNSEAAELSLGDKELHQRDSGEEKNRSQGIQITQEEMEKIVADVQIRLDSIGSNLSMGLAEHRETQSIVARITDKTSHELVKQFPSEAVLELRAKLDELVGLIFDKKA